MKIQTCRYAVVQCTATGAPSLSPPEDVNTFDKKPDAQNRMGELQKQNSMTRYTIRELPQKRK